MNGTSNVFILPGLGNSLEGHWQTIWERKHNFKSIQQTNWDSPERNEWVEQIQVYSTLMIHQRSYW